ncbi:MAG TPA: NAD(+) synthase [Anaerolineaceae bacterium]|nr:NAD(+) synthase [Anaerolineaceae bacterium]
MENEATSAGSKLRLAVVVPEVRVADVVFNTAQIQNALGGLKASNPDWVIFPRLCLTGASCGDLFRQKLLQAAALQALIELVPLTAGTASKVLLGLPLGVGDEVFEVVALLSAGQVQAMMLAPWPESPALSPSVLIPENSRLQIGDSPLSLQTKHPFRFGQVEILLGQQTPGTAGADLLINLINLPALAPAEDILQTAFDPASRQGITVICSAGASESTTDQVSSGKAEIWQNGHCLAAAPQLTFETQVIQAVSDQSLSHSFPVKPTVSGSIQPCRFPFINSKEPEKQFARLLEIQSSGLMKRLLHTHQQKVILGVSGGADSSQALLVCCRAFDRLGLDRKEILAIHMPGPGSSHSSRERSTSLADLAGVTQRIIPIGPSLLAHLEDIGHPQGLHDVTFENAQARERTQILMDLANQQNALVVGTGDLSEIALGWCTFNGDHMSMYNVNCGLPKTLLLRTLVWAGGFLFGQAGEAVAQKIAQAPISPELLPLDETGETSQKTEEVLGPYELHDFFLFYAIGRQMSPEEVFGHAVECFQDDYTSAQILATLKTFYRRFFSQQFKRSASPDGPQLLEISLSPRAGWRMPSDASSALWLEAVKKIQIPGNPA